MPRRSPSDTLDELDALSESEAACLRAAASGRRTHEIAQDLQLSKATVESYLSRATRKLGFTERQEALAFVRELLQRHQSMDQPFDQPRGGRLSTVLKRSPWPFPTRWRRTNTLTGPETIVAILLAALTMLAAAALYLLALTLISDARERESSLQRSPPGKLEK